MTCHSKFAESQEARFLRQLKQLQAENGHRCGQVNITSASIASHALLTKTGIQRGNDKIYDLLGLGISI